LTTNPSGPETEVTSTGEDNFKHMTQQIEGIATILGSLNKFVLQKSDRIQETE